MSAVFTTVATSQGYNADSQGEAGFVAALLAYAAANNSGSDSLDSPFDEAIRRFEATPNFNPHALARLKQLFADPSRRYANGQLK